ncbi:helix-turn-helix domain-containing protein [Aestuariibacter halophilus]|uniref:Helix-turn-helix domain-containing protein n=1 Tax=Fluctibacter halophilus TaxID=226011 RepID=A0ABS8G6X9_9ALTE|nr:helix-turn-helix domain-containing protein [Aestuariibacter halophilus]MCC2614986.1 helix-turn-helix domain-containing protein [Aestuariibacter halophilus]
MNVSQLQTFERECLQALEGYRCNPHSLHLQIRLNASGEQWLGYTGGALLAGTSPALLSQQPGAGDTAGHKVSYPLVLGTQCIGDIGVSGLSPEAVEDGSHYPALMTLSNIVVRYLIRARVEHSAEQQVCWCGNSPALRALELRLPSLASVDLPVLLIGPCGSGKRIAASTLHCHSHRHHCPLVYLSMEGGASKQQDASLHDAWQRAHGGTLSVRLSSTQAPARVAERIIQWQTKSGSDVPDVRLLVSVRDHDAEGFSSWPWLRLTLPTLSQRREDIPALLTMLRAKYRGLADLQFSDGAVKALQELNWKDNVVGLERFVAHVALSSPHTTLEGQDIQQMDLADFAAEGNAVQCSGGGILDWSSTPPCSSAAGLAAFVQAMLSPDWQAPPSFHVALVRALQILRKHGGEPLPLTELARQVFVSPAHLSALFRRHLGASFKPLLQQLRVERAKTMLRAQPRQSVTDIAFALGFHDLRHFEKTFRRHVGCCPRVFRQDG